jgi:hypothetical protein
MGTSVALGTRFGVYRQDLLAITLRHSPRVESSFVQMLMVVSKIIAGRLCCILRGHLQYQRATKLP